MADQIDHTEQHISVEVPTTGGEHHGDVDVVDVSGQMVILTWITFGITAAVLYKVAWKPILAALERREASIQQAVDDAENVRKELANIEKVRASMVEDADTKAREIVDKARHAAEEVAQTIEAKAREESKILIENARREIHTEQEKAMARLRKDSAEMVISISRKVIGEKLDEDSRRRITESIIDQI